MARTKLSFEITTGHEERTYGGQIRVEADKSARWAVRERYFRRGRDADGTLEYAIRYAGKGVDVFGSADGKCVINIPQPNRAEEYMFLIVSGYVTRKAPEGFIILGKEYFVTADRFGPEDEVKSDHVPVLPCYNLTLRFDRYDLERAGIPRNEIEEFDVTKRGLDIYYLSSNTAWNLLALRATGVQPPDFHPGDQRNVMNRPNAGQPVGPYPPLPPFSREEKLELERRFGRDINFILELRRSLWDKNVDFTVSWWDRVSEAELKEKIAEHHPCEVDVARKVDGSRSMTVKGPRIAGTYALLIEDKPTPQVR